MTNELLVKERDAGVDFLRILAVIFVILGHVIVHDTSFRNRLNANEFSTETMIFSVIYEIVILGVNLFFLISGYFGVKFSKKKICYLFLMMYAVSFISSSIQFLRGEDISLKYLFFPFTTYWFLAVYIILLLISSFINILVSNMNGRDFCLFCFVYLFFWGIQDTFFDTGYLAMNEGYSVFHGFYMLVLGGV